MKKFGARAGIGGLTLTAGGVPATVITATALGLIATAVTVFVVPERFE